ncbi:LAFE_0C06634g1_1 [Lachancea fermentati]|uniref:LAFE_0C06634g1_1 n=1 Tax=Lachancea fermentati TaxID=4955 RepID=A0A1G4MA18_LACFM|nr:LAFE_0C06634g1_1 [Lachancea fermentati]
MIQNVSGISPKNQHLLNGIVRELALSFSKPALEFIDLLIESFMYPKGNDNPSSRMLGCYENSDPVQKEIKGSDSDYTFEPHDLGYGRLLEMIHLRQLILKIKNGEKSFPSVDSSEYIPSLLAVLEEIHTFMIHLLKELSNYIEVIGSAVIFKEILTEHLPNFRHAFHAFKSFNEILQHLMETVKRTGVSDDEVFQINQKTIELIKKFTVDNVLWFEELMTGSKALKEYLLFEDCELKPIENVNALNEGLPKSISAAINSPQFEDFLQIRKAKLRVCHRRVF